ncbi:polycomb protein EED [Vigna unguiculata]|uniref:Polycomb protein EED n=1 Tax=Vigna unguiculata TaxID=3917 RepID=A0A4D6MX88_VIGUN|nr:polycomb protein EED [Vigna unguiculata]
MMDSSVVHRPPKFDVERRKANTRVEISCVGKPIKKSFLVDWLRLDIGICNWWTDVRLDALNEVSWACNVDGTPFVVAGGINKVIPVVEVGNEKIHKAPDIGSGVPSLHEILGSSGGSKTP